MGIYLAEARKKFEVYLRQMNFTAKTIRHLLWNLDIWIRWVHNKTIVYLDDITETHLREYLRQRYYRLNRKGRQDGPISRNKDIFAIKRFYGFLIGKDYISNNPSEKILYVKEPQPGLKTVLTKRELVKLFRQPDTTTARGYRNRLCFELFYATGMRRAELVQLRVQDVRFKDETILIVQGKGQQDRVVPVNQQCLTQVRYYIEHIRPKLLKRDRPTDRLIVSTRGRPIIPEKLNDALNIEIKKAKLKKKVTLHTFRHTIATQLIQKGMPLRYVQEFLGHRSLNSTMVYLNLSVKDLQREYRKCHPREKDP